MKLDKISSIAEILSSSAVLITLVYGAVRTKQNTDAVIATSRPSAMLADSARSRRAFRQYSGDPELKRYLSGEVDGLEGLRPCV